MKALRETAQLIVGPFARPPCAFAQGTEVRDAYRAFRLLPLTEAEFRTIEQNVPPYIRW